MKYRYISKNVIHGRIQSNLDGWLVLNLFQLRGGDRRTLSQIGAVCVNALAIVRTTLMEIALFSILTTCEQLGELQLRVSL